LRASLRNDPVVHLFPMNLYSPWRRNSYTNFETDDLFDGNFHIVTNANLLA
jgi:hypothetical protein